MPGATTHFGLLKTQLSEVLMHAAANDYGVQVKLNRNIHKYKISGIVNTWYRIWTGFLILSPAWIDFMVDETGKKHDALVH